jgi:hypothetical protein
MIRFRSLALVLAICGIGGAMLATHAQSTSPTTPAAQQRPQPMAGEGRGMAMPEAQPMAMQEKMMSDMKAMDVKLDALVTKMNAAKGGAKVDAMADALTELVQQHKAMREGMMQMHDQMMMQMHGNMAMPMGGAK